MRVKVAAYDPGQDCVYVQVLNHRPLAAPASSSFAEDDVAVDRDRDGNVVGYEIFFVRRDGLALRPSIPPEVLTALGGLAARLKIDAE